MFKSTVVIILFLISSIAFAESKLFIRLKHPKLKIPYSVDSSLTGICVSLGFDDWQWGSNIIDYDSMPTKKVTVNEYGEEILVATDYKQSVREIICVR